MHKVARPKSAKKAEKIPLNQNNVTEEMSKPKFFFEIIDDVLFYRDEEYLNLIESFIENLQLMFKIRKQVCVNYLQVNRYDFSETVKAIFQDESTFKKIPNVLFNNFFGNVAKNIEIPQKEDFCLICGETKLDSSFFSLDCQHKFCLECYQSYLFSLMEAKGFSCFLSKCPCEGCEKLIEIDDFEKIFQNDKSAQKKIQKLLRIYLINTQPNFIKHCPAANCPYIYKLPENMGSNQIKISCPNSHSFCHLCGMFPHFPLSCSEYQIWFLADKIEFKQNYTWIASHCKKCPKCNWPIQKNEGCNHMTCRLCHHEFCWLCFQNYHGHRNELCNKLTVQKIEQKKQLVQTSINFANKAVLAQNEAQFKIELEKKEENFIKKNKNKMGQNQRKLLIIKEDLEEYLFICSKLSFIFGFTMIENELLQNSRKNLISQITRLENMCKLNENLGKSSILAITKKVLYLNIVQTNQILEKFRKNSYFADFYNL